MFFTVFLIGLGALSRVLPHPPNAVALGALALYAGARLPKRWALVVPLAAMALSDLWLDWGSNRPVFSVVRLSIYATYAVIAILGILAARRGGPLRLTGLTVAGSGLFFLTTNFAVWASSAGSPHGYPATLAGLGICYLMALPFLGSTLAADLAGTAALFGGEALARRASRRAEVAAPVGSHPMVD